MGYLIVAAVAIAVAVFAMQNTTPVTVKFVLWELPDLPVAAIVLASLAAGLIIAGLPLSFRLWRLRSRVRSLEARTPAPAEFGLPREPRPPRDPGPPYGQGPV
jgi:uncharacterized integral membrane protein